MNEVHYKTVVWQSVRFDDNADMNKISELIENGEFYEIFNEDLGFIENYTMYDTEEYLDPHENDNEATLEVYKNGKIIYKNA